MFEDYIYKRISELRLQKGVSAREMSLDIGQSEGYINSIENRRALPSMSMFLFICDYLGVTPAEFFEPENRDPAAMRELLTEARRLSPEELRLMTAVMRAMK